MAVREYDLQVPYGVVKVDGVRITAIEEKAGTSVLLSMAASMCWRVMPWISFLPTPSLTCLACFKTLKRAVARPPPIPYVSTGWILAG